MSFQFIGSGGDLNSVVAQANTNILELKNREITTIYKDSTGNRRIIIGKLPDGTHGIVISKEDVDVIDVFS